MVENEDECAPAVQSILSPAGLGEKGPHAAAAAELSAEFRIAHLGAPIFKALEKYRTDVRGENRKRPNELLFAKRLVKEAYDFLDEAKVDAKPKARTAVEHRLSVLALDPPIDIAVAEFKGGMSELGVDATADYFQTLLRAVEQIRPRAEAETIQQIAGALARKADVKPLWELGVGWAELLDILKGAHAKP